MNITPRAVPHSTFRTTSAPSCRGPAPHGAGLRTSPSAEPRGVEAWRLYGNPNDISHNLRFCSIRQPNYLGQRQTVAFPLGRSSTARTPMDANHGLNGSAAMSRKRATSSALTRAMRCSRLRPSGLARRSRGCARRWD